MLPGNFRGSPLPIPVSQATLNKFFPSLPPLDPKSNFLAVGEARAAARAAGGYHLHVVSGDVVEVRETHCLACRAKLLYNGYYSRTVVFDGELRKQAFRVHRKYCPRCRCDAEVSNPALPPKYCTYHENYPRRARQHYMNGLMPSQARDAMAVDLGVAVPKSTLVSWTNRAAGPLRAMLAETPVPSSGRWGTDEIHLRVAGEKGYLLNVVDGVTKFAIAAGPSRKRDKVAWREHLRAAKRGNKMRIEGLVKDGSTVFGNQFQKRGWDHIAVQTCRTFDYCPKFWRVVRGFEVGQFVNNYVVDS